MARHHPLLSPGHALGIAHTLIRLCLLLLRAVVTRPKAKRTCVSQVQFVEGAANTAGKGGKGGKGADAKGDAKGESEADSEAAKA